jgi:CRISPR-associated autoregulator DevR family
MAYLIKKIHQNYFKQKAIFIRRKLTMTDIQTLTPSKGLAITYLARLSIASPSGGRSEIENLNVIKKIREGFLDYPYASSQAMKRALRDTLKGLGFSLSPIVNSKPSRTAGIPLEYIDDDLFGYMDPSSKKDEPPEESAAEIIEIPEADLNITKEMLDELKPKKVKEKIGKYFLDNTDADHIDFKKLNDLGLTEKEIEGVKKAITKDDTAVFNKMKQNFNGVRKSTVSMTPLLSLSSFNDNIDFGANMMGLKGGVSPMPYETEIHRGWYRISLYIDLNRIGTGDGFVENLVKVGKKKAGVFALLSQKNIDFDFIHKISDKKFSLVKKEYSPVEDNKRYDRAKALLDAIRFLAPSGRSSNWLIDLTPKLMVAAYVKGARTPFLESPLLDESQPDKNCINLASIKTIKDIFADGIENLVVGYREDLIQHPCPTETNGSGNTEKPQNPDNEINVQKLKEAFDTIDGWLRIHFDIKDPAKSSDQSKAEEGK